MTEGLRDGSGQLPCVIGRIHQSGVRSFKIYLRPDVILVPLCLSAPPCRGIECVTEGSDGPGVF